MNAAEHDDIEAGEVLWITPDIQRPPDTDLPPSFAFVVTGFAGRDYDNPPWMWVYGDVVFNTRHDPVAHLMLYLPATQQRAMPLPAPTERQPPSTSDPPAEISHAGRRFRRAA